MSEATKLWFRALAVLISKVMGYVNLVVELFMNSLVDYELICNKSQRLRSEEIYTHST